MKYAFTLASVAVLMSAATYAQEGAIPKEALEELQYFVGDWTTKIEYGDKTTEGTWSAKWSAEGTCLVINISETAKDDSGEPVKTHATGMMGWDAPTERIKEVEFWSNGDTYDARYKKMSDTKWEGKAHGVVGGKQYTEKVSLTRTDDKEFVWRAFEYVLGGEKQHDLDVTITKVPARDNSENRSKLTDTLGWLIGEWEVDGNHDQFGDWIMTYVFDWKHNENVMAWDVTYDAEAFDWSSEFRYYWDWADEKIKYISFPGPAGGPIMGSAEKSGDNKVVMAAKALLPNGSEGRTQIHLSLQDDGTLLFRMFRVLDDKSLKEQWEFVLTKK